MTRYSLRVNRRPGEAGHADAQGRPVRLRDVLQTRDVFEDTPGHWRRVVATDELPSGGRVIVSVSQ